MPTHTGRLHTLSRLSSRVRAHAPPQRLPNLRRRRDLHRHRYALHDKGDILPRRPRRLALKLGMRQLVGALLRRLADQRVRALAQPLNFQGFSGYRGITLGT